MNTIWKFPLKFDDFFTITMPRDAKILTVQMQHGVITLWALVDPASVTEERRFRIVGTGQPLEGNLWDLVYRGTVQDSRAALGEGWHEFVWHVFEVANARGCHDERA